MDAYTLARMQSPLGRVPPGYRLAPSLHLRCLTTGVPVRGLFTDLPIAAGQLIGEYRGVLLDRHTADAEQGVRSQKYVFAVTDPDGEVVHVVDAAPVKKSSFLRYVNAPNEEAEANTSFFQDEYRIFLTALRDISAGTELLAWYGPETKAIVSIPA